MCKNEDIIFRQGCVEKNCLCRCALSLCVHAEVVVPHPGPRLAGSEQISVKESGGSSLLCTHTRRCLLCSFRRRDEGDKSPGPYVWVGRRACVNLLCGWGDLSTTGLCQQLQELFGLLEYWLCAPCKELSHHSSNSSPSPVCLGLAVQQENGMYMGIDWCCIFRANAVHSIKYKEQYWAVLNSAQNLKHFVYKRFNIVWASVFCVAMHKYEL